MDIAAGHGRYVLDAMANGVARPDSIMLRDYGDANVREGAALFAGETSPERIGVVTSGGFGPSLNAPVAMGYLPTALATPGTLVFADVRSQRLPCRVAATPFVPNTYKR